METLHFRKSPAFAITTGSGVSIKRSDSLLPKKNRMKNANMEYAKPMKFAVHIPRWIRSARRAPIFWPVKVAAVEPSASNGQQKNMLILWPAVMDATTIEFE